MRVIRNGQFVSQKMMYPWSNGHRGNYSHYVSLSYSSCFLLSNELVVSSGQKYLLRYDNVFRGHKANQPQAQRPPVLSDVIVQCAPDRSRFFPLSPAGATEESSRFPIQRVLAVEI